SLGFIPTGWYPTSVRVTSDAKRLLIANGKGIAPKANPLGPQPGINSNTNPIVQYIGRLFRGTLSVVDLPARKQFERQLKEYTALAYRCRPLRADATVAPHPATAHSRVAADNPIPSRIGQASPI